MNKQSAITAILALTASTYPVGCGNATRGPSPAADDAGQNLSFWAAFEIDGDWAEFYPTLEELSAASDAVFLGRIQGAARIVERRGDAREDLTIEVVLDLQVVEGVHGAHAGEVLELALIAPMERSPRTASAILTRAAPEDLVLFFLRKRASGTFRPTNGYGILTSTTRAVVDAPLNPDPLADGVYARELAAFGSVEELARQLAE